MAASSEERGLSPLDANFDESAFRLKQSCWLESEVQLGINDDVIELVGSEILYLSWGKVTTELC